MHLINEIYVKLIKNLTINKIKYIFLIFLLSPFLILIVIIKPVLLVRFGHFDIQRIGIISYVEHYLLQNMNKKKKSKTFDIWVIDNHDYNKQFYLLLKRKFLIISELSIFYKVLELISKYIKIYSKHIIVLYDSAAAAPLDISSCQLSLTSQEIKRGESFLKRFNIPSKSKIICFTCRDDLFLKKKFPSKNFSYHNYRDNNINNYIPTIKALIKKDFYVVRMGQIAKKKINIKNKKFIDYPFHPLKNDFMDFFFAYKCYFWIGGTAGIDNVAATFRKPLLDLNMVPIGGLKFSLKKTILCLKIHKNHNNRKLSLTEIFASGAFNSSEEFRKKKIKLEELTSNQIKDIVFEMIKLMKNSWKIKGKNDLKLQKKFKKLFLSKINQIDPKLRYKFNALYSLSFLRKNSWFLK